MLRPDDAPPITDESFSGLISTSIAPTDGRCGEENEHGDMSIWNVSLVKDMTAAFKDKSNFNADLTLMECVPSHLDGRNVFWGIGIQQ